MTNYSNYKKSVEGAKGHYFRLRQEFPNEEFILVSSIDKPIHGIVSDLARDEVLLVVKLLVNKGYIENDCQRIVSLIYLNGLENVKILTEIEQVLICKNNLSLLFVKDDSKRFQCWTAAVEILKSRWDASSQSGKQGEHENILFLNKSELPKVISLPDSFCINQKSHEIEHYYEHKNGTTAITNMPANAVSEAYDFIVGRPRLKYNSESFELEYTFPNDIKKYEELKKDYALDITIASWQKRRSDELGFESIEDYYSQINNLQPKKENLIIQQIVHVPMMDSSQTQKENGIPLGLTEKEWEAHLHKITYHEIDEIIPGRQWSWKVNKIDIGDKSTENEI